MLFKYMRKKINTRKSYGIRRNKNRSKTSKNRGGTTTSPTTAPPKKTWSEHASAYGKSAKSYAQSVAKANQASLNMPVALAATSYKINSMLVHLGVNYEFSNGYNAQDYTLQNAPGNAKNDGRGVLKPNAIKGKTTGFQSGFANQKNEILEQNKKNKKT
jgi:hypothetical protein